MARHARRHVHARAGRKGGTDYTYRSSNVARGLFRLAFPDAITQMSDFSIVNDVVHAARPIGG